jgi:hypothetical protein
MICGKTAPLPAAPGYRPVFFAGKPPKMIRRGHLETPVGFPDAPVKGRWRNQAKGLSLIFYAGGSWPDKFFKLFGQPPHRTCSISSQGTEVFRDARES